MHFSSDPYPEYLTLIIHIIRQDSPLSGPVQISLMMLCFQKKKYAHVILQSPGHKIKSEQDMKMQGWKREMGLCTRYEKTSLTGREQPNKKKQFQ